MLGDTIMCLPVLETAREVWPGARLCAIVTPRIAEMLRGVSYIDEFLIGTNDPLSLRRRNQVNETKARLRSHQFDVAILLGGDQYGPVFYQLGTPVLVGPEECVYKPLFTHAYSIGGPNDWGPNERLGAIRTLGYKAPDRAPRLEIDDQARIDFRKWLDDRGLSDSAPYVIVHPFGSEPRKWWPIARVPELAKHMYENGGAYTILVGGPESREVARTLPAGPGLVPAIGEHELTISQLMAAIESAQVVITTDSAPFHMAGALGRPIVGLFPSIRSQHKHRYSHAKALLGNDPACARLCRYDRCQAQPCRQICAISIDEILDSLDVVFSIRHEHTSVTLSSSQ